MGQRRAVWRDGRVTGDVPGTYSSEAKAVQPPTEELIHAAQLVRLDGSGSDVVGELNHRCNGPLMEQ